MENDSSKRRFRRSQFAVVLVLAPLNGTFERKCLVVPFSPSVLKLGRQTTARTAAGPDNGFFDSRVLSRQHAEVWADRESGKIWLRDCKSSNGTYINKRRLSSENTESEPYELKKNDQLDLGIDIICNDDAKQMYKKISAKVEKVSMLPLQVGLQQRQQQQSRQGQPQSPSLARSPSLETLRSVDTSSASPSLTQVGPLNGRQSDSIFGGVGIEALALNHANTTAGGLMIKDAVKGQVDFELAAKRLVAEIRAVRADTAKIESVATLLEDIKRAALEAEKHDKAAREKLEKDKKEFALLEKEKKEKPKSSSVAALKAENARIRAEIAHLTRKAGGQRGRGVSVSGSGSPLLNDTPSSPPRSHPSSSTLYSLSLGQPEAGPSSTSSAASSPVRSPATSSSLMPPESKVVQHNILVLVGTTFLVTLTGVWIMFFFNPPMAPRSQNPLFFNILSNQ